MFRFSAKTSVIVTDDLISSLLNLAAVENAKRIGLIIDRNLSDIPDIVDLSATFSDSRDFDFIHQKLTISEPTTDLVDQVVANLPDKKLDLLIGIGGGSTIDLVKAVSVMAVNPGKTSEYHGTEKQLNGSIKKITIPTTAGTGAEVTPGAVLVNESTKFKRALGGSFVAADYAILCAKLTQNLPDEVMATTGMDAIAHAVESYTARCANPITQMYSKEAFRLVYNNLPKAFENPNDLETRKKILIGSCLAGFAIFNSDTGACHSLAYPLGIYNKVPHGVAISLILDKVVNINIEKGCELYEDLVGLIDSERDYSKKNLHELLKSYPPASFINKTLSDYGINRENYQFLAERGLDLESALSNNPVDFDLNDSKRVFCELISA